MIYTIHMSPDAQSVPADSGEDQRFDAMVVIPDGLAKWALFFPPAWLAFHKLWWELAIYLLIAVLSFAMLATSYALVAIVLAGFPGFYLLLEGHQLRRNRFEAKGFTLVGVADASDEKLALQRFLVGWEPPVEAPVSAMLPPNPRQQVVRQSKPSFGMFPSQEF